MACCWGSKSSGCEPEDLGAVWPVYLSLKRKLQLKQMTLEQMMLQAALVGVAVLAAEDPGAGSGLERILGEQLGGSCCQPS